MPFAKWKAAQTEGRQRAPKGPALCLCCFPLSRLDLAPPALNVPRAGKNPIPPGLWVREGPTFDPVCAESQACLDSYTLHEGGTESYGLCKCSGLGEQLSTSLEVVDRVVVPKGAAPGRYVLQWRWDCEESDQVWAGCSDITVIV